MNRRKFLSCFTTVTAAVTLPSLRGAAASSAHLFADTDMLGVLHDSARCIGCRKCEAACQKVNADVLPSPDKLKSPEPSFYYRSVMDKKRHTDFQRFTVVNRYKIEDRLPVYRKFQCNHCIEPACASACFVKALRKTPEGPVIYSPDLCVGCRYCMIACPFYVPAYDYDNTWNPLIYKCTMCAPRLAKGLLPGCVESCPKEALTFGRRKELLQIARQRIVDNQGIYVDHIYGEYEVGGTCWLYLSPVPHKNLGQPEVGKTAPTDLTADILGTAGLAAGILTALLGATCLVSSRRNKKYPAGHDAGDDRGDEQ
jgi:Fe-S-cluster-containing dehydrogenase component